MLIAQGIVSGLALGNHVTAGLAVLAWLGVTVWRAWQPARAADPSLEPVRRRARACSIGWPLVGLAAGLLVYLYLPLRARAQPPINWGDPREWAGFWWVVSGAPYRGLAFGLPGRLVGGRVAAWASLLIQQFGWPGLALGCLGLVYGAPGDRWFVWVSAALAALASAFAVGYDTADSYAYLIPLYIIFSIWIGLGTAQLLQYARRWHFSVVVVITILMMVWFGTRGASTSGQVDASQDRRAIVFADEALAAVPARAIVVTAGDRDTFTLWYAQYALGRRPDIAVVAEPLLDFAWYRRNLRATYPGLNVPDAPTASWRAALAEASGGAAAICVTEVEREPALVCQHAWP